MKKVLLSALIATTGCSAAVGPQEGAPPSIGEKVAKQSAADTDMPGHIDTDDVGKVPRTRQVAPSTSTSPGSALGGGSTTVAPATWNPVPGVPTIYAGTSRLLTDGTVMVQDAGAGDWWKLTPDATGSYRNGTWSQLASMPNGYQPLYFASAVLPDGRVIVEGGEYQAYQPAWQTLGAIYDPVADTWTSVDPPSGWDTIGDAQSVVLADGRFMLANCCTEDAAILDPRTLSWTPFGTGKADINDEEGWTLLWNGKVLTVDTNNLTDLDHTEIFDPRTATWSSAGDTPVLLADQNAQGTGSWEMGPQVLRPDGTVFAAGATGHSAVYHPSGKWTAGPDLPVIAGQGQLDIADGPAALLPNGHVLMVASPGVYEAPAHVLDFDGRTITEVGAPPQAPYDSSYNAMLLVLPTGEILFTDQSNDVEIYASTGEPDCGAAPQVDEGSLPEALAPGKTYELGGTQLHGISQAVAYGDDVQAATNYPLVRIRNRATGHVTFARTHDFTTMSIAPGLYSRAKFDVPSGIETGASDLEVVANGIHSQPVPVNVGGCD